MQQLHAQALLGLLLSLCNSWMGEGHIEQNWYSKHDGAKPLLLYLCLPHSSGPPDVFLPCHCSASLLLLPCVCMQVCVCVCVNSVNDKSGSPSPRKEPQSTQMCSEEH